jgi:hypothetical protein
MIKILFTLLLFFQFSFAENASIIGNWYTSSRSFNKGTEIIEKEYLNLYANHNFELLLLVSVQKDEAYIKDLRIEVSGVWEAKFGVLVYVIKSVNVPVGKEVYMISQRSLENLSASFKYRYVNSKIYINEIRFLDKSKLITFGSKSGENIYSRTR